jgi:hypothetical protein
MMGALSIAGLAALSALLFWLGSRGAGWLRWLDAAASAAFLVLFAVFGAAVANVMVEGEVYMTTIHGVILQPAFLIGGGYAGAYTVARTALLAWKRA